jgi:DNA-binding XRE family transcriptional regulator
MMTQTDIAKHLGFSQPTINLTLSGKRKVSWPLAERLAEVFPGKSIKEWKHAKPSEIRAAFKFLERTGDA